MTFYERIKKYEYKFTDTEDVIAEFILDNKEAIIQLSIQTLAKRFFTVPNTIIRLCKKMEYDGFSHLKNSLKEELKQSNNEYKYRFELNINKTLELIDYDKISKVADIIYRCRNVVVYGLGQNNPLCEMFIKELRPTKSNIRYYSQRHEVIQDIGNLSEQDLVFIISLSGQKNEVLEVAKLAKNNKCKIIALTNLCDNDLQLIADESLYCYSSTRSINGYDISDKIPLMIILRAIVEQYWLI